MRVRAVLAVLMAIAVAGAAFPAAAQRVFSVRTAGDLAALCAGEPGGRERAAAENFCDGFAQGVVSLELDHGRAFCIPRNAPSRRQTMQEFVTWARDKPSRLDAPAARSVVEFFRERFPCGK